jgi:uncharacterized protein (DUF3820 family)
MAESLFTMPFGRFKGKDIEDLPRYYLDWLIDQSFFVEQFPDGLKAVLTEVKYRDKFGEPKLED